MFGIDDFDDVPIGYLHRERKEARDFISQTLKMSNSEYIEFMLNNGNGLLNYVVSNHKFPAYDILLNALKNNWVLTEKQRHAISNVYIFQKYNWKQEWFNDQENEEIKKEVSNEN